MTSYVSFSTIAEHKSGPSLTHSSSTPRTWIGSGRHRLSRKAGRYGVPVDGACQVGRSGRRPAGKAKRHNVPVRPGACQRLQQADEAHLIACICVRCCSLRLRRGTALCTPKFKTLYVLDTLMMYKINLNYRMNHPRGQSMAYAFLLMRMDCGTFTQFQAPRPTLILAGSKGLQETGWCRWSVPQRRRLLPPSCAVILLKCFQYPAAHSKARVYTHCSAAWTARVIALAVCSSSCAA